MDVVLQAALSMGLSLQEYWSGLPFPLPGDLPDPGIKHNLASPTLAARFFTTKPSGKPTLEIKPQPTQGLTILHLASLVLALILPSSYNSS